MNRRQLVLESEVNAFGIVPNEIVNELAIEGLRREQFLRVIIGKFFLDGAVETLAVGIHLGRLGIGMIMRKVQSFELCPEVFHELRAVVGQNEGDGERKYLETEEEELPGGL